jgi:hypothetical protein
MYPLEVKKASTHTLHRSRLAYLPYFQAGCPSPTAGASGRATFFLWTIEPL